MKNKNKTIIIWANVIMIVIILLHDADHLRQAICWSYTIPWYVKIINIIVYLPSVTALYLGIKAKRSASTATIVNGLFIALTFAKIHISGASGFPYWGIWNRSFFALEADALSWAILSITVATGIGVAMAGSFVRGRQSVEMTKINGEEHLQR